MRVILATLLVALSTSCTVFASPTGASTTLKQATRNSIVERARNPWFNRRESSPSCLACTDCCPGFCSLATSTQHAVYANAGVPVGSRLFAPNPVSVQSSLTSCIRACCASSTCVMVAYVEASGQCTKYDTSGSATAPYTTVPGQTVVQNRVSCLQNRPKAGDMACCNAPLVV